MYDSDSFYTLTNNGQIGLAFLSLFLTAATVFAAGRLFRLVPDKGLPTQLSARIGVAVFMMWIFVWLSPQVYYLYYQTLFDGLPWQVVIQNPPEFHSIFEHVTFSGPSTLSAHAKGALAWLLILYASAWPTWRHISRQRG